MGTPAAVTVVIPTYNRLVRLRQVLAGLAAQCVDEPFEVVVVSDGSTDGTDEYLVSGEIPLPVVVATQANLGPSSARNRGVGLASAELVLFLDDDVVPATGLVRAHLDAHRRYGGRTVVIGPMLNPPNHQMSSWVRWEQAMLARQYDAMEAGLYGASARQFYTGNASLLRRHVIEAGGFDATLRRAEDVELAYRLNDDGLTFAYVPQAVGLHYAERSFDSWLSAAFAYGCNDVIFGRDRGRPEILDRIAHEYRSRHPLVRALTRMCVPRSALAALATVVLSKVVAIVDPVHLRRTTSHALSGAYNLAYYRGVADELGGADRLRALLTQDAASR